MRPPSILVLSELPKLLPEAGIPRDPLLDYQANPNEDLGLRAKWRAWIDAHKTEIQKLEPTANGVGFTPGACTQTQG